MKILVFGSFNIDKVYSMPHLPERGETLYCKGFEIHVGGKGLNQALAFSKAGEQVFVGGKVGKDGEYLTGYLKANGIDISDIDSSGEHTGHTIIETDPDGQNQMILFGGANREITEDYCDYLLSKHGDADLVLMQYETSCVEYMLAKAHSLGIKTALNPSPYVKAINDIDFSSADILILNEYEAQSITGKKDARECAEALYTLGSREIILTLGADGSVYYDGERYVTCPAFKVNAVDTTGAGDTFTGYCLSRLLGGAQPYDALITGSAASAIEVTKPGAAETIPSKDEVERFLLANKTM
ncbi:MAG: ribokinase [Clostridia bacterium]|nr:ribokinase [Clostridia bacterium]